MVLGLYIKGKSNMEGCRMDIRFTILLLAMLAIMALFMKPSYGCEQHAGYSQPEERKQHVDMVRKNYRN